MQLFVLQSIVYDQMEEKSSNRLTATLLKNCRLESIECSKYQFIFVTAALRVLILLKDNAFGFLMQLTLIGYLLISGNTLTRN